MHACAGTGQSPQPLNLYRVCISFRLEIHSCMNRVWLDLNPSNPDRGRAGLSRVGVSRS